MTKQSFEEVLDSSDRSVAEFKHERRSFIEQLQHILHGNITIIPLLVLVISFVGFGLVAGERFYAPFNLSLIIQQVTIIGILGIAQTLIILTAGIDLSVAAIMVLSSVVMGNMAVSVGMPAFIAIPIGFITGMVCGAVNGLLITRFKLPPFIATLGTWNIFFALNLWYSGSQSIRSQAIDKTAPSLKFFGERVEIFGTQFTYGSFLMIALCVLFWYLLNRTAWGKHVYAVGDDPEAAELSGIRTSRILMSVYITAGLLCGLAAWAAIGRIGSISPQSFYEGNLEAITAVVIGGTSLFGGRGSVIGTIIGALIVGVFRNGLALAGVDVLWQVFAIGWLIIIAVAFDQWVRKVSA
ncbi:ABC transporter permease [Leucothrix mucor]|uniref:ABC transporter permease n=1 Tax=Leucothrix mucor TaxID=45248 RepID=UPI0003B7663A|nr:ABC transporter permease [Leucothrix mucor]